MHDGDVYDFINELKEAQVCFVEPSSDLASRGRVPGWVSSLYLSLILISAELVLEFKCRLVLLDSWHAFYRHVVMGPCWQHCS